MSKNGQKVEVTFDTTLPEDYGLPYMFSTPPQEKLEHAIRQLRSIAEKCVGTDHYAHSLEKGERVMVAYSLVERLSEHFELQEAYWAVWKAIKAGILKAHRRFWTHLVKIPVTKQMKKVATAQYTINPLPVRAVWHREINGPYPLVGDFDPDFRPALINGLPSPRREFDHFRKKYESFVVTYAPRQLPVRIEVAQDGPLDERCERFRFKGKEYQFTPSQADAVKILWNALIRGSPEVSTYELLKDSCAISVAKIFEVKRDRKKVTHEAFRELILRPSRGRYRLAMERPKDS